ncbi:GntR family transcriptional regulator [Zhengella mangrovi]|uniref:GntR family transcriptional regulator n=1 Tax=Zhengella mangrovi TaxID=1982044 RepID=A0A2G1QIJ9_9HYPH|nr:GntR family transcriptional regulator [Zhengella mangrovi]PHP65345.1 GntR family transcriptional regulator [Zhengella mangrovi]
MTQSERRTSVETIRLDLARRIVVGLIEPGTALDEGSLAAEFGVSRTPVREALRQLASSGLVRQRPHRKAMVTKPDETELHGMFAVMGHLEALCAKLCAATMSPSERRALERLHMRMETMVQAGDAASYTTANEEFHGAIYDGTRNAYLAEVTFATRLRVQPFRRAQFGTLGRLAASHGEHTAIVDAILRGEGAAAEAAMASHIGFVEHAWHRYADLAQASSEQKALQEP